MRLPERLRRVSSSFSPFLSALLFSATTAVGLVDFRLDLFFFAEGLGSSSSSSCSSCFGDSSSTTLRFLPRADFLESALDGSSSFSSSSAVDLAALLFFEEAFAFLGAGSSFSSSEASAAFLPFPAFFFLGFSVSSSDFD